MSQSVCRFANKELTKVLDLGMQPLGNGFLAQDELKFPEYFYQLECGFNEESCLFQIINQPKPEQMFNENYAFFSSTSTYMQNHFAKFAMNLITKYSLNPSSDLIVEIGSNDGILLEHFLKKDFKHIGIEPSGKVASIASSKGLNIIKEFFDIKIANKIVEQSGKAKIITSANVLCHIPNIKDIAFAIAQLLDSKGIFVFEDPYLGDVITKNSFDQIYDEHVFLFSAISVQKIFNSVGLELIDCEPLQTHGGSMRYTLAHKGVFRKNNSVEKVLENEFKLELDKTMTFFELQKRIEQNKQKLISELEYLRKLKKRVVAYGATSKSTTIYNYAGIGTELVSFIYDNSPLKIGKYSPGMHIPIISETEFINSNANVTFLAAWNHSDEIIKKNYKYTQFGGKWLTHIPTVSYYHE